MLADAAAALLVAHGPGRHCAASDATRDSRAWTTTALAGYDDHDLTDGDPCRAAAWRIILPT